MIRPPHVCQNWLCYCACSCCLFYIPLKLPFINKNSCPLIGRSQFTFGHESLCLLIASLQNKASFPFYQYCLSTGFQVANGCTWVSVTQNVPKSFAANITVVHWLQFQIYLFMLPADLNRPLRMSWDTCFWFSQAFLGDSGVLGKEGTSVSALERPLLVDSGASHELLSASILL